MRKYIVLVVMTFFGLIVIRQILGQLGLGYAVIGLPLIASIVLGAEYKNFTYVVVSMVLGFLLETFLGLPFGSLQIPYIIAGFVTQALFRRFLWISSNWRYYLGLVVSGDVILLLWLFGYTKSLVFFNIWPFAISAESIFKNGIEIIILHLLFAFPIYSLVMVIINYFKRQNKYANFNV